WVRRRETPFAVREGRLVRLVARADRASELAVDGRERRQRSPRVGAVEGTRELVGATIEKAGERSRQHEPTGGGVEGAARHRKELARRLDEGERQRPGEHEAARAGVLYARLS